MRDDEASATGTGGDVQGHRSRLLRWWTADQPQRTTATAGPSVEVGGRHRARPGRRAGPGWRGCPAPATPWASVVTGPRRRVQRSTSAVARSRRRSRSMTPATRAVATGDRVAEPVEHHGAASVDRLVVAAAGDPEAADEHGRVARRARRPPAPPSASSAGDRPGSAPVWSPTMPGGDGPEGGVVFVELDAHVDGGDVGAGGDGRLLGLAAKLGLVGRLGSDASSARARPARARGRRRRRR